MKHKILFSQWDWLKIETSQKNKILKEISSLSKEQILGSSVNDLCDYFNKKYQIHLPTLREDEIIADQQEAQQGSGTAQRRGVADVVVDRHAR